MSNKMRAEYKPEKIEKPFFYDDPKFMNAKAKAFEIEEVLNRIRKSPEDGGKTNSLTNDQMVEFLYHDLIVTAWKHILEIEVVSGKRMNGLLLQFTTSHPEIELDIIGTKEKKAHDYKSEAHDTSIFSYTTFISLSDIVNYALEQRNINPSDLAESMLKKGENEISENEMGVDIMSIVMDIVRTIIADNNPMCATLCIDTALLQSFKNTITGKNEEVTIKYAMNYTEFPNGKCVKSTYAMASPPVESNLSNEKKHFLNEIKTKTGGNIKMVPVSVGDIVLLKHGLTSKDLDGQNNKLENDQLIKFKEMHEIFNHYFVISQAKRMVESKSTGIITDDVFDKSLNKYDQLNTHTFYLYKNNDIKIYERLDLNAANEIKNIFENL